MPEYRQSLDQSIILMGVSGCGKSTVGELLSERTGAPFFDGDHFHPEENVAKMADGIPLTDEDRQGWLITLRDLLNTHSQPIIIACSALKQSYRDILESGDAKPRFVYLQGGKEILLERLEKRAKESDHFMPASLLDSQLDTLEQPNKSTLTISIKKSPTEIADAILTP